jgi:hypothetical protein
MLFLRCQSWAIVFGKTKYFINTSFIVHLKRFLVLLKVTLLKEKLKGFETVFSKKLQEDDILVMVPHHELNETFDKQIIENNTYCFQNFQLLKNDDQFKLSENQFKLRFNGSTRISNVHIHQISDLIPKWKDFCWDTVWKMAWRCTIWYNI